MTGSLYRVGYWTAGCRPGGLSGGSDATFGKVCCRCDAGVGGWVHVGSGDVESVHVLGRRVEFGGGHWGAVVNGQHCDDEDLCDRDDRHPGDDRQPGDNGDVSDYSDDSD